MKNREIYWRDPLTAELLNNGVSKVAEIENDPEQPQHILTETGVGYRLRASD